jgi:hypothetical protein
MVVLGVIFWSFSNMGQKAQNFFEKLTEISSLKTHQ